MAKNKTKHLQVRAALGGVDARRSNPLTPSLSCPGGPQGNGRAWALTNTLDPSSQTHVGSELAKHLQVWALTDTDKLASRKALGLHIGLATKLC